jgi:hypothetical protein
MRGGPQGEGAYRAGQIAGLLIGVLLLAGGAFYFVQGIRESNRTPKKRPKRRPRDDET